MDPYIKRKIIKYRGASGKETEDPVAVEKKLGLFLNGKEIISVHCSPLMIHELINGLLLTEGILKINIPADSIRMENNGDVRVYIAVPEEAEKNIAFPRHLSGVALCKEKPFKPIVDGFSLTCPELKEIFNEFHQRSELFRLTGCFHSAALSDGKSILAFAEDIGRHNAVDKVTGYALLNDISFRGKLMLVSCRISSEIVSKCARWEIPIVASRGAPTDLAVEIAEAAGMTLIGFVRGENLNIYTNPQRIT